MSRIACLRIPQFQIAVHQKHEPGLKGIPLVLLAGKSASGASNRSPIFMCSSEAERKEIFAGMRLAQARALCSDLLWRECDNKLYLDAQNNLIRALISCSPRVAALTGQEPGTFILDASGMTHLGGEKKFCKNVLLLCAKSGFTGARIGIAGSAFTALVATRHKNRPWCIIPAGQDAIFLAPLSIHHLPLDADMQEALTGLGIKSIRQLVELPANALSERFGEAGSTARQLALGIDNRLPTIPPSEKSFHASVDLGYPVQSLAETTFVLKAMLDRIVAELKAGALLAEELELAFYNENDRFDTRPVKLIRPSSKTKFLLDVCKLSLEAQPLMREFTGLTLAVSRFTKETWQQVSFGDQAGGRQYTRFFNQSLTSFKTSGKFLPESLIMLLQRFRARFGDDLVFRPVANDQHFPESAGAWLPVLGDAAAKSILPVDIEYIRNYAGSRDLSGGLVTRRAPHTTPVLIKLQDAAPSAIAYEGRWHQVKSITAPECLSGLWWDRFIRKSYYVAFVEQQKDAKSNQLNNSLVLLVHDHQSNNWYLEGYFD